MAVCSSGVDRAFIGRSLGVNRAMPYSMGFCPVRGVWVVVADWGNAGAYRVLIGRCPILWDFAPFGAFGLRCVVIP